MLNIEKYKDELCELPSLSIAIVDGKINECEYVECKDCRFSKGNDCMTKRINWLISEYKEPILTEKEKEYLKKVIEPVRNEITIINKTCMGSIEEKNRLDYVQIWVKKYFCKSCDWLLMSFVTTRDMPFKNMELYKRYTLEELDL